MLNSTKITILLLFCICATAYSQQSISFANITIEAATQRANIENKNIFIDAYAPWCGPCKIMDVHFQDKEVRNYFNRNFINVKIDTDTEYGKEVSRMYGIAFLPTILILDKDGNQRFKVDKLITRDELISLAQYAMEGPKYPEPTAPTVSKASPKPEVETKVVEVVETSSVPAPEINETEIEFTPPKETEEEVEGEKILYVLDENATNLPPEILFEEAYFRLQLNDGSYKEASAKYLATQEDWFTEKNLKFIFDFLYDTDSKEFDFFIQYQNAFLKYIDAQKIEHSIKILVENKLYQGIPRPSFEQSEKLLSLIDKENAGKNNYHYFLNRLYVEGNNSELLTLGDQYFKEYESYNQAVTLKFIETKLEETRQKSKIKNLVDLLQKVESQEENYDYLVCNSKIHLALSDKTQAIVYATKAINLAKEQNLDSSKADKILEMINEQ